MPRPKGCKCGVLKPGEVCPVHDVGSISRDSDPAGAASEPRDKVGAMNPETSGARARKADPRPRPGGRPKRQRKQPPAATSEQLEEALRKVLKLLTVPMRFKCDFCADYMTDRAAYTAAKAIEDDDIREAIAGVYEQWDRYAGAGVLVAFFGVPMMHHLAPEFIYRNTAPLMGLPPRAPARPSHPHAHAPAAAPAPAPEPVAEPADVQPPAPVVLPSMFAGMDFEQLVKMGESMGVDFAAMGIDLSALDTVRANGSATTPESPEPEPEPEEPDPAAVEAEAALADQDPDL